MIYYSFEDIEQAKIDECLTTKWISAVINKHGGIQKDISYIFCSDAYIIRINREYLNHDYYTDIITFDYCEDKIISGDIFISLDTVLTNSKEYNTTFEEELNRVIIHGILHLLAFKDKTPQEASIMRQMEDEALALLKTI